MFYHSRFSPAVRRQRGRRRPRPEITSDALRAIARACSSARRNIRSIATRRGR